MQQNVGFAVLMISLSHGEPCAFSVWIECEVEAKKTTMAQGVHDSQCKGNRKNSFVIKSLRASPHFPKISSSSLMH